MIHPTAVIDSTAHLGRNVSVGAHCFIGPRAVLGDDCILHPNVTIWANTICGHGNVFFPGAVIGSPPQDMKYKGGDTRVEIGDKNNFREHVTVHAGTEVGSGITRVGSNNMFLVGTHIAHDVSLGNHCVLANSVHLAGHVCVEDRVTMGGIIGIHHFTTIGTLSYIGGMTRIVADVPPFMKVEGQPSRIRGFNEIGMRRWGFSEEQILGVREAYRTLFSKRAGRDATPMQERLTTLEGRQDLNGEVRYLCESLRRSLVEGKYGRQLEGHRRDSDADRRSFYQMAASNAEPQS